MFIVEGKALLFFSLFKLVCDSTVRCSHIIINYAKINVTWTDPETLYRPPVLIIYLLENYFLYFSSKTYAVGTRKNCLNKTVLLSTQNICLN